MKIINYITSLLPTFGKDRVIEDIRITRNEIKEATEPSYKNADVMYKGWTFKSAPLKEKLDTFKRMVKHGGGDNAIAVIHKGFKDILENLSTAENLIEKIYGEDVASGGITYLKAQLLQFVETVGFVSKYARKFLIYVYVCETQAVTGDDTDLAGIMTPAELKWIDENFISFCTAFGVVSGNPQHVKKSFDEIPDIVVTGENAETLKETIGESKTDPFQMNLIPVKMNLIYHVRLMVAEWQADRYKAAKEEARLLELRKLNLQKLSSGKPDALIQKDIDYLETRIQGLNFKIAKMEKDYNV